MSNCPKCGAKVREGMNFCPKCGASLKAEQPAAEAVAAAPVPAPAPAPTPAPYGAEKAEKHEKQEKEERRGRGEKEEKYERRERRELMFMGPLLGGLFLVVVGLVFYLVVTGSLRWESVGAAIFITVGIIIIVGAVYAAVMASRRHPKT